MPCTLHGKETLFDWYYCSSQGPCRVHNTWDPLKIHFKPTQPEAPVLWLPRSFPGLQTAVDYVQQALQAEVTALSGQEYGSFATLNGVPLQMQFITDADVTSGARRAFGQSCLTEQNTVYEVRAPLLAQQGLRTLSDLCACGLVTAYTTRFCFHEPLLVG